MTQFFWGSCLVPDQTTDSFTCQFFKICTFLRNFSKKNRILLQKSSKMPSCGAERRRRRKFSLFVVNFSRNFQIFGQKSQSSAKKSGTFWRRPVAKYYSLFPKFADTTIIGAHGFFII